LIAVYKTEEVARFRKKIPCVYSKITTAAGISAISATIQNMLLVAESLKLGSCWLDSPLLYDSEINKILKVKNKLMAILTFGYPDEKGKRVPRKSISEFLVSIK
ncbi:MAG: nitroreductase family protein, partial [Candidatus Omnitrophota bacterium]